MRSEVRVGKLSKDAFKPTPDSPKEERMAEMKVGHWSRSRIKLTKHIVVAGSRKT